jgi:hypothetical protein
MVLVLVMPVWLMQCTVESLFLSLTSSAVLFFAEIGWLTLPPDRWR